MADEKKRLPEEEAEKVTGGTLDPEYNYNKAASGVLDPEYPYNKDFLPDDVLTKPYEIRHIVKDDSVSLDEPFLLSGADGTVITE